MRAPSKFVAQSHARNEKGFFHTSENWRFSPNMFSNLFWDRIETLMSLPSRILPMIEVIQPNFYCPLGLFFLCGCVLRRELRAASNFGFRIMGPEMGRLLGLLQLPRWCETGIFKSTKPLRTSTRRDYRYYSQTPENKVWTRFFARLSFFGGFSALDKSRATFLNFLFFFFFFWCTDKGFDESDSSRESSRRLFYFPIP